MSFRPDTLEFALRLRNGGEALEFRRSLGHVAFTSGPRCGDAQELRVVAAQRARSAEELDPAWWKLRELDHMVKTIPGVRFFELRFEGVRFTEALRYDGCRRETQNLYASILARDEIRLTVATGETSRSYLRLNLVHLPVQSSTPPPAAQASKHA